MEYKDIKPIGENRCAFLEDAQKMFKHLGIKDSIYDICEKLNYPKYVLDCMRTYEGTDKLLTDKDVYLNYEDSWIFLFGKLTLQRRISTKYDIVRTFTDTCRDLVGNDIVETFLVNGLNENNKDFLIISNDIRDDNGSFQIYEKAETTPDFKVIINNKEYLLELKCISEKNIGFINDKFINNDSYRSHRRYEKYKNNIYFLKIDILHEKAAIFTYDELNYEEVDLTNIKVVDFNNNNIYSEIKKLILNKFN